MICNHIMIALMSAFDSAFSVCVKIYVKRPSFLLIPIKTNAPVSDMLKERLIVLFV